MARLKDKNSIRQRALVELDKMQGTKRDACLKALGELFPNSKYKYLETLWATHRRESKANGSILTIYTVMDIKRGVKVVPYMKVSSTFVPELNAALTPELAKNQYILKQQKNIDKAKEL